MRTFFSRVGKWLWRFMIIFSFVVNIILVIVLLALGLLIFEIKNNVADPLVGGLHGSFVGLDQATIDWTIPVRDSIPVQMTVPLETDTVVTLTSEVPLSASAMINLNGSQVRTPVNLTLPVGLSLPVRLDLDVPIDQQLDVSLDVRAVIPLEQTQLHDVATNLRLLFEPLAVALDNLPDDFGEAGTFVNQIVTGNAPNLIEPSPDFDPWPGFSRTAGLNYDLFTQPVPGPNRAVETGIVQHGGIPALDEQMRPDVYAQGGPAEINTQSAAEMNRRGIDSVHFDGSISGFIAQLQQEAAVTSIQSQLNEPGAEPEESTSVIEVPTAETTDDLGIVLPSSTPSG